MEHTLQAAGAVTVALSVWLRAVRKMTVNFTAFWGIAGVLAAAAGTIPLTAGWLSARDTGRGRFMREYGTAVLAGGFAFSILLSRMKAENQERAIRRSLMRENGQI